MNNLIALYKEKLKKGNFFETYSREKNFSFFGIPRAAYSFLACSISQVFLENFILCISAYNTDAELMYREALSFLPSEKVIFLPGVESIPYEYSHYPSELKRDRIRALSRILSGKGALIFTSIAGFLQKVPSKVNLINKTIYLQKNLELDLESFLKTLIVFGYQREEVCEQFGTFSKKGDVIDIFSPFSNYPIRIDFFEDTIENIRIFDPNTQKSLQTLEEFILLPCDEFFLLEEEKEIYKEKIFSYPSNLLKPINELGEVIYYEELNALIHSPEGILSYFQNPPVLIFPDRIELKERTLKLKREYETLYEKRNNEIICLQPSLLLSFEREWEVIHSDKEIEFQSIKTKLDETKYNYGFEIQEVDSFKGKIRDAREKILELHELENANILITSSFSAQTERLNSLFSPEGIVLLGQTKEEPEVFNLELKGKTLYLVLSELRNGFILKDENLHIWSDNDIFGRNYKRKTKFKKTHSRAIDSFIDLKEGDFVVHVNHGIGRFVKLEKVQADGKIRDFLKLEYAEGDTLFVPLDQISLVQKYIGGVEHPTLDSLGKSQWKKKLERAKSSVNRLAEELLVMYSNRMKLEGYAFPKDTIWQEEFEAEFEYEETPDQLAAIEAVKRDMETPRPMDRLICGDVGYGKTEVAIRAAFKAILAGKQVLFIAPTTILVLQHFNNFQERYKNYPIKIEMISRFKTQKQVRESLQKFNQGEIDMLVGTHALLTSQLKPKNLGLLVIDEEQRFGVNQKEAIKKYKNLVDVLTLSATPIPRTLHMSLTGIRDLSIIETPPKDRQSIETYVLAENIEVIQSAIRKELERGGQVFYLYNRVDTIEQETNFLREILPEVSFGILHGQLSEEEVEEAILDFNNKKYDVLVTTTIIESGIDMPNVNTILVKRADTFGLAQLYQIRGRVGRSGRKAYAYLFYPPDKALSEQAEKRLNTIFEYQELGSGFKVAMRDLEIRGAGNLLGKEQSGNIIEIGFDLYVQMLNEAIANLKKEEIEIEVRTTINLSTNFYIPEEYIQDTKQKIEFYKRFERANSEEEVNELALELKDRFGEYPEAVKTFILLEKIRVIASKMGFESISEIEGEIRLRAGKYFKGDPNKIIQLISKKELGLSIVAGEPNVLRFKPKKQTEREKLIEFYNVLKKLEK